MLARTLRLNGCISSGVFRLVSTPGFGQTKPHPTLTTSRHRSTPPLDSLLAASRPDKHDSATRRSRQFPHRMVNRKATRSNWWAEYVKGKERKTREDKADGVSQAFIKHAEAPSLEWTGPKPPFPPPSSCDRPLASLYIVYTCGRVRAMCRGMRCSNLIFIFPVFLPSFLHVFVPPHIQHLLSAVPS